MSARQTLYLVGSSVLLALLASCGLLFGGVGAVIEANPTALTLGAAKPGETLMSTIVLTNTGTEGVAVELDRDASWISISPTSLDLAAGQTAVVDVIGVCTDTISESMARGTLRVNTQDRSVAIPVSIACFSADLTVIDGNAYLSGEVGENPTTAITLANTTGAQLEFSLQNTDPLAATPEAGTVPKHGLTHVALASADSCTSVRSVQDVSFDVISAAGTIMVDAFVICAEAPANAYNVDIRFFGDGFEVDSISAFLDAAAKWESVITDDIVSVAGVSTNLGDCSADPYPREPGLDNVNVDDLLIYAGIAEIDGLGKIVASAGPCIVRSSASPNALLPVYGTAFFDSADMPDPLDLDRFEDVVLHEMGHVLGIGTMWNEFDLIDHAPETNPCRFTGSFTSGPEYTGIAGIAAYEVMSGQPQTSVPLEEEGGPGTQCGHWDEQTFGNELMTGTIGGPDNPLSRLTGDSLLDLGYATDSSAYDQTYELPACNPICLAGPETDEDHASDILLLPRYKIGSDGAIQPL